MPRAVSSPEVRGSSDGAPGVDVLHSFIRSRDPAVPRVPGHWAVSPSPWARRRWPQPRRPPEKLTSLGLRYR
ncbi:hypothetical protein CSHISOI_01182 [Colletotrichum shisoi]|uniref:Uncharacterized protein n=1 Tax=Colletotrichum shisoi TaxID=2078593 RepID=A0A5Q4C4M2_9PEZI|nr:hypothetical protein CSHISOI_01182 [Colletotrichum shisoi]